MEQEQFLDVLKIKNIPFEINDNKITVLAGFVDLNSLTTLPEGVTFSNGGGVDLRALTTLPEGVTFSNGGGVYLSSLTTLPEGVTFSNGGGVDLSSLTTLPEGVTFSNGGGVDLRALTTLPEGVTFSNGGYVDLSLLTDGIKDCGNSHRNVRPFFQKGEWRVQLGCFNGNKEQSIEAIRKKYGNGSDYELKVIQAFQKFGQ